jgi:ubiquitin-conjugating enzyme E2 J2
MLTPNGRFKTDFRLCLSMSDYHPDTWNPAWSVATILTGLLSFMLEDTETTGSIRTTEREKQLLARSSMAWNREQRIFLG